MEGKISLPIRSALIPVFYQHFRCLAQDCRDNCCLEDWGIYFNKNDYLRLRRLDAPPALRERLDRGVRLVEQETRSDSYYGRFNLEASGGHCPLLNEGGLCDLQRACGHNVLPRICITYPRKSHYTTAAKEYSLSPSCEGVLQLLWDLPGGVEFVEEALPKAEWRKISFPRQGNLLPYFAPVRETFFDILQNRAMSLTERMLCLGICAQRLQHEDWERFDPEGWIGWTTLLMESDTVAELDISGNRDMYLAQNLNVLNEIAALKRDWSAEIYKALEVKWNDVGAGEDRPPEETRRTFNFSKTAYAEALTQFKSAFSDYEYFFENLMVAVALRISFPQLGSKEELWKSYVSLCNFYSFYRFVSVLGCRDEETKERLFHMIARASRYTLHGWRLFSGFQEHLFKHDSSTLAHMAILLRWD